MPTFDEIREIVDRTARRQKETSRQLQAFKERQEEYNWRRHRRCPGRWGDLPPGV